MKGRPRLTANQRLWRGEARAWGTSAAQSIRVALDHQHQADQYQQLGAKAGIPAEENTVIREWQERADRRERDAVRQAIRAGHYANQALNEGRKGSEEPDHPWDHRNIVRDFRAHLPKLERDPDK